MKCLMIGLMLFAMGCEENADPVVDAGKVEGFGADSFSPKNRGKTIALIECRKSLKAMKASCSEMIPAKKANRPDDGIDYVGNCLWAMDRVYGDKFPIGEHVKKDESRPGFFFECLDRYPGGFEDYCCYKLKVCESEVKRLEDYLSDVREKCNEYCGNRRDCDCW